MINIYHLCYLQVAQPEKPGTEYGMFNNHNIKMKKRFNLNDLKVKSFITDLKKAHENTVKGGQPCATCDGTADGCYTNKIHCPNNTHPLIC